MAIRLQDKLNTVAPDADYPHGRIRDKAGATSGTPVSTQVYGDIHQFFAELLTRAGITANGLPDNATNGYQYFDALSKVAGFGAWKNADTAPTIAHYGPGTGTTVFVGTPYSRYIKRGKTITWVFSGVISAAGTPTGYNLSLPTAFSWPTGLSNAIGLNVVGILQSTPVNIAIKEAGATITAPTGHTLPASTSMPFSFSVTFEVA